MWQEVALASGHRRLINRVTGMRIEYADHGKSKDIDEGRNLEIFNRVQEHLNILSDEIFGLRHHKWDYDNRLCCFSCAYATETTTAYWK